jgi:hypothetical protein
LAFELRLSSLYPSHVARMEGFIQQQSFEMFHGGEPDDKLPKDVQTEGPEKNARTGIVRSADMFREGEKRLHTEAERGPFLKGNEGENGGQLAVARVGEEGVDESSQEEVVKDRYWVEAPDIEVKAEPLFRALLIHLNLFTSSCEISSRKSSLLEPQQGFCYPY